MDEKELMEWKEEVNKKLDEVIKMTKERKEDLINYIVEVSYTKGINRLMNEIKEADTQCTTEYLGIDYSLFGSKIPKYDKLRILWLNITEKAKKLLTSKIEKYLNDNQYVYTKHGSYYNIDKDKTRKMRECSEVIKNKMDELVKILKDKHYLENKYLKVITDDIYDMWLLSLKIYNRVKINAEDIKSRISLVLKSAIYKGYKGEEEIRQHCDRHIYEEVISTRLKELNDLIKEATNEIYNDVIETTGKRIEQYFNENNYIWLKEGNTYYMVAKRETNNQ